MNLRPLQYSIYKGKGGKFGALQLNFQHPHYYNGRDKDFTGDSALEDGKLKDGWKIREGAIFLEITSAKSENVYDWDNKIILALSISDMEQILLALVTGKECSIMHDPGAKTENTGNIKKYLNLSSPKGLQNGCMMTARQVVGEDRRSHTVPLSPSEVVGLRSLLQTAISKALAW